MARHRRARLAAVDASAGDVRYAEFDDGRARPGRNPGCCNSAEVLLVEPVSAATNALVAAPCSARGRARVERIAAESGYADARDAERALAKYVEPRGENENDDDASFSSENTD